MVGNGEQRIRGEVGLRMMVQVPFPERDESALTGRDLAGKSYKTQVTEGQRSNGKMHTLQHSRVVFEIPHPWTGASFVFSLISNWAFSFCFLSN